ncbi:hypothetical protein N2152v2_010121 [Parachlorella kessleri]
MLRPVKAGKPLPEDTSNRSYLVIAAAGDVSEHGMWMDGLDSATFDVILLYYGSDSNFTCPQCRDIVLRKGPKWRLLYEYMTSNSSSWRSLSNQYKAVMVPDDDLRMNSGIIDLAFKVFSRHGLLLGQPSICRSDTSYTYWETVKQKVEFQLHYTAFVEVMAPMFEIGFFNTTVLDTLRTAYSAANSSAASRGSSATVQPDEQQQHQDAGQHAVPASEAQQADCQGGSGRCKRTLRRAEPTLQRCGAAALSWIGGGWPLLLSVALLAMLCYAALYHQPARAGANARNGSQAANVEL